MSPAKPVETGSQARCGGECQREVSRMSRALLLVVCGMLQLMPGTLLAQQLGSMPVPDVTTMAEDYNYTTILQQHCSQFFDIDDAEAEKLKTLILTVMLKQYGEARTKEALESALERMATEARKLGLGRWCEVQGGLWAGIRYPELLRK